jgi:hypothetical protein
VQGEADRDSVTEEVLLRLEVLQAVAVTLGEREMEEVGHWLAVPLAQALTDTVLLPVPVPVLEAVPLTLAVVVGEREAV